MGEFRLKATQDDFTIHHEYLSSIGNNRDVCLIYIDDDLSYFMKEIPIIMENFDIAEHHRSACWTAGWGVVQSVTGFIIRLYHTISYLNVYPNLIPSPYLSLLFVDTRSTLCRSHLLAGTKMRSYLNAIMTLFKP